MKTGQKQNREKAMNDDELRLAYIKILTKYKLKGIDLIPISEIILFK